jgi:phage tail sheath protein FI
MEYRTPGVYTEEIATLPPSVAQGATAIPAFLGYTEKGTGISAISTLAEFEESFGGPSPSKYPVTMSSGDVGIAVSQDDANSNYLMYYALSLYFANGGGHCYIVSVGNYDELGVPQKADFESGLAELGRQDEPTLIVLTDAINLAAADYYDLCKSVLGQCEKLGDRFGIFDVKDGDVELLRGPDGIGENSLKYGAAYHPYLQTSISYLDRQSDERVVLPPSAAMAGVYARVDRDSGVWKAPANVSLSAVIAPTERISHEDQQDLNVDIIGGKSVNAIRQFAGRGTIVWGARTLAGNDNEWRYVSVRRLASVIEDSIRKALTFTVFEPNDAATWLKVQVMIESYLLGLWQQGALAGPSTESAYFVHVGLGKTMTPEDVLEGRMIVEIGFAPVRPAEFIIIRLSQQLQET